MLHNHNDSSKLLYPEFFFTVIQIIQQRFRRSHMADRATVKTKRPCLPMSDSVKTMLDDHDWNLNS